MIKPHDDVYNSSKYRFALLDGSMDGVAFRFFGADRLDWYDGRMTNWRITDCNFSGVLLYDSGINDSKFYDSWFRNSDFRKTGFDGSVFNGGEFKDCKIKNCDIEGLTIDGINVEDALEYYKRRQ